MQQEFGVIISCIRSTLFLHNADHVHFVVVDCGYCLLLADLICICCILLYLLYIVLHSIPNLRFASKQ